METAAAVCVETVAPATPPAWSLAKRIVFRFVFCYFLLYCAPDTGSITDAIPGGASLTGWYVKAWHSIVPWIAIHVFHVTGQAATYFPTGSGDTTLSYILNLCYLVLAVIATLVWSLLDRKRPNYSRLHFWLRIVLRYTLAMILFGYGFAKVFPLQFGPPGFSKLVEPYGEFSPMGVLWSFMGASIPYIIFSGACEVLGGLLILFRRTTTLGALVSAVVMLNVVVLNFCYDVPVKLYSTNILMMALILAAPDFPRLFSFFVRNRATEAADLGTFSFRRRWMRMGVVGLKVLFVGYLLFSNISQGLKAKNARQTAPRPPLYGLYDVVKHEPPVAPRWRKLWTQGPASLQLRTEDDTIVSFAATYDKGTSVLTLKDRGNLTWSHPDSEHVLLEGQFDNAPISISLRRIDTDKMRLKSTGFHWIYEFPFNR